MALAEIDFDFDNFDPDAFHEDDLPPPGNYQVVVVGVEDKAITANYYRLIEIHFQIYGGELNDTRFKINYYVGCPTMDANGFPKAALVAKQKLAAAYKAITGIQLTNALWPSFEDAIKFKPPVEATLTITSPSGTDKKFANLNFKKKEIKAVENPAHAQTLPHPYASPPATNTANWGSPPPATNTANWGSPPPATNTAASPSAPASAPVANTASWVSNPR